MDLRGHKISQLEAQLRNIVYGKTKVSIKSSESPQKILEIEELAQGQNMIDMSIKAGIFNEDAFKMFIDLGLETEDVSMMTTFIVFDFYEFETQISPLGLGDKPHYGCTSRFKFYVDDFFLFYLQSHSLVLSVFRSNGLDFVQIGFCQVSFQGLIQSEKISPLHYYGDIVSIKDSKTVIGKLDYSMTLQVPMAQAIRAFKERTVALNLMTIHDSENSNRIQPRATLNHLNVEIKSCRDLILIQPQANIYISYSIFDETMNMTETVYNPKNHCDFNHLKLIPLYMGSDLDRYLRGSIVFFLFLFSFTHSSILVEIIFIRRKWRFNLWNCIDFFV